jgi:hypothetical protein
MKYILILILSLVATSVFANDGAADKILVINITEKSQAIIGRDTLTFEDLSKEIETRLWKSYLGTGKMHTSLQINYHKDLTETAKSSAIAAIKKGQTGALTLLCLEKFKNRFDQIGERRQEKIKKQFPVLFQ